MTSYAWETKPKGDGLYVAPRRHWLYNACECEEPMVCRETFFLTGPKGIDWCRRCGWSMDAPCRGDQRAEIAEVA